MSAWDGLNRRKFPRVNFPCLVILKDAQGQSEALLSHTENIGIGGVCVILRKQMKVFAPVDIELDLLDADEHVKCSGKVVWCIRRKSDASKKPLFYDMGIEFVSLSDKEKKRIEATVEHFAKKGMSVPYR